ncbi:transcription elongation factor GreA [Paenibacillus mucilaginosus]|uniref:Transcription elongation factor GreA n=3 Tax=Paenibacillus mucilaginosus TaxID=61624 RepID=H6NG14_9BACL|nr:transcription elongation factor GreA [Paenibacillus mucilaginosus]AEI43824.1 GreA [Paenibacillus mucilaginosus KNP414]AFC31433.1 GreA [Paenibacillus mucilaginosus 3016]AFH63772.1 transcription elongation factor GreA [Paenibacillus mucilaginosus K02]MCG7212659.1 transcription elongation factor GreA [Paenibacillus mucilaginosus]WDM25322.1 transcription elongation factor GreA [Paenibacillus mucilaginosus]
MANEEVILTREGFAKLEQELEELKTVKRKELATRLKTAISYGDLKENSEYHSAKDDQAFLETRILTLEQMLKKARIADNIDTSKVNVGSVVVLYDVEFAEKIEYRIVGPSEADVLENRISYESPLGMSLMNKAVGDKISVNAPMGVITYELLEIRAN